MTSLYFDLLESNELVATVSIRQMNIRAAESHWAYEIAQAKNKAAPTRGTVEDSGEDNLLLVSKVLNDYFAGRKATHHDHSNGV